MSTEAGRVRVDEICRKRGISDATFHMRRQKYGGVGPSELRRLRQLEEENAKLKRLVAALSLDKVMLQDALSKALKPSRKRELANDLMQRYGPSMRKARAAIQLSRVVHLYRSVARDNTALVMQMNEITRTRVHYGYRRVHVSSSAKALQTITSGYIACTANRAYPPNIRFTPLDHPRVRLRHFLHENPSAESHDRRTGHDTRVAVQDFISEDIRFWHASPSISDLTG